jgi:DNA-directed RNA polymerase specialized sigma24 family protein
MDAGSSLRAIAGEYHSYVARRLGPDAADDLTAEVFLIAFRARPKAGTT